MSNIFKAACATAVVAGLTATGAAADKEMKLTDETFVKKAASGGMHEVELAKIVKDKAADPAVKAFAEKMIADHTKANEELKVAAKSAGIAVPEAMMEKELKETNRFKEMAGTGLDREYVKHMVKDHEEDIALFTAASKSLKNADLKAFATKSLPTLKEHLEMVKALDKAGK